MLTYVNTSLERLRDTLGATNVISTDYCRTITGWAQSAVSEAYEAGRQAEAERWLQRDQVWRRKGDSPVVAIIIEVVRVHKGSPAWENGRRDHVRLGYSRPGDWTVNTDEFVRNWTRQR
jgi:hypothetical protein